MSEARVHNFCLWQYLSEPFFVFFILSYLFFTPRPIPPPPSNRPLPPLKFCMGSQETKIPKFWAPERPTAHFFSWGQDDQNFKPGALMAICYNLLCFYLSWVVFGCFLASFFMCACHNWLFHMSMVIHSISFFKVTYLFPVFANSVIVLWSHQRGKRLYIIILLWICLAYLLGPPYPHPLVLQEGCGINSICRKFAKFG